MCVVVVMSHACSIILECDSMKHFLMKLARTVLFFEVRDRERKKGLEKT